MTGPIATVAIPSAPPPGTPVWIRGADGTGWPAVAERTEETRPGLVLVRLEGEAVGRWLPGVECEWERRG